MKERPKVGDRVEFRSHGVRIGTVIAVSETGVHFLVELPFASARQPGAWKAGVGRYRQIGLNNIIRVLPGQGGR